MSIAITAATKVTDIYSRRVQDNGWLGLAADIVCGAVEAVKNGEPGAEIFFYSPFGDTIIAGLGLDIEIIKEFLGLPDKYNYPEFVEVLTGMDTNLIGLAQLAEDMMKAAAKAHNQIIKVNLNGGLNLILISKLTTWRLSLSRRDNPVTTKEKEACRKAFGIPDDTGAKTVTQQINSTTWHIVRFAWGSARQIDFFEQTDGSMVAVLSTDNYTSEGKIG